MRRLLLGVTFLSSLTATWAGCELGDQPIKLTRWSGEIRSPGYEQGMYPNNQNCTWKIRVNTGSKIKLTFVKFSLEDGRIIKSNPDGSKKICSDYLKVTEGSSVLLEECGQVDIDNITSSSNEITINFVSDESGQPPGFSIKYTGVTSDTIEGNTIIETPGYPRFPPQDQVFKWRTKANPTGIVVVRGEMFKGSLPWCGESPIIIINEENTFWNKELCLEDNAMFADNDMTIIYNHTADTVPWVGRLKVDYVTGRPTCSIMCDNSTSNLKSCMSARDMSGRNYRCLCMGDYDGRHCEVPKSVTQPCYSSPCKNNGNCTEVDHKYQCSCPDDFTGSDCETEIDYCEGVVCQNGGACLSENKQYKCKCVEGFTGTLCSIPIGVTTNTIEGNTIIETPGYPDVPPQGQVFKWKAKANPTGIVVVRGEMFNGSLPWCGESPITIINEENTFWNKELCLEDNAMFADKDMTIIYNHTADTVPWVGRLKVEYVTGRPTCSIMCDNSTSNLKSCMSARDMSGRNYRCLCMGDYDGRHCEVPKSVTQPCYSSPCKNSGNCTEVDHKYQCSCPDDFTGSDCETEIDYCGGVVCQNGGTCLSENKQYKCKCVEGFTGTLCSIPIGVTTNTIEDSTIIETPGYPDVPPQGQVFKWKAKANPTGIVVVRGEMFNGSLPWCGESPITIINEENTFWNKELCLEDNAMFADKDMTIIYNHTADTVPWVGRLKVDYVTGRPTCSIMCDNSTSNLKSCMSARDMSGRNYRCLCMDDYDGNHCEVPKSVTQPCYSSPCKNSGNCTEVDHKYQCSCPDDFTGSDCETEIDYCEGVVCQNGGACLSENKQYKCECVEGFTGTLCSIPIASWADCELGDQPIKLTRWSGEIRSPGYERRMYPNNQNCTWKIRVNTGSKVKLTFVNFFLEEGRFINSDPSGPKKVCSDYIKVTEGSSVLLEECGQVDIDNITSSSNEITINFVSDESGQPPGFSIKYTGVTSDTIEGSTIIETPEYPDFPPQDQVFKWRAKANLNGIVVVRGEMFNGSLPWCGESPITIINEENTFWNKELCLEDNAMFADKDMTIIYNHTADTVPWVGRLKVDYVTGRPTCSIMCDNSTSNLKSCISARDMSGRNYRCLCMDDYDGKHCEVPKSVTQPCYSSPCKNNGNCTEVDHKYQCSCPDDFTGSDCETEIDYCEGVVCQNGGTCLSQDKQYKCECVEGFSGDLCEYDIDDCVNDPCQNNGTCTDRLGSHSCTCAHGFKGQKCEAPYDACDWLPCHNGGTCLMDEDDFRCTCSPEFTGTLCSIPIDSAHCLQNLDTEFGSGLTWRDTLAGNADIQPCPPGIIGNATRKCVHDSSSPTGGKWTRPDLGDCVSPRIMEIDEKAKSLLTASTLDSADIEDVTRDLANATSVVRDQRGARLYPGDLVFATGVINIVAEVVSSAHDIVDRVEPVAQLYGEAVDNIIDPRTVIIWRNTKTTMIGQKVSSLLSSTERLADSLVEQRARRRRRAVGSDANMSPDPLSVITNNLEFRVSSLRKEEGMSTLPVYSGAVDTSSVDFSSIELPSSVADIATVQTDSSFDVYFAKFKSVASLLSLKEDRHNGSEQGTAGVVNSDIVSGRVLGMPESLFQTLDKPVIITFRIQNTTLKKSLEEFCVFMNMSAKSDEDRWLRNGCQLHASNDSHVICHCYHLTNFALLMDVYGTSASLDDSNSQALSYISYIGGSLSILGCLATIIVFEYFRLRNDRVRIHQQLAACIIAVQAVFLIGFSQTQNRDTPVWACKTVAILLHYFLTAMFCWMLVEGIHLYVALVKVFKRGNHIRKYIAIGWGIPLVIVGISVGVFFHNYGSGQICWLNREMLLVCFVPTVGLVVLINTVILGMVLDVMLKSLHSSAKVTSTKEEKSGLWMSLKAAAVLLPLLGLTWTLGFLSVDAPGSKVLGYIFTYLFTICNSFQGVVFFIFHCMLNADVHSAYDRRYKKRKRLTTMTSNDITTLRRKRSCSENDTYVAEPSTVKSSIDKSLSDISFVNRHPNSPFPDDHVSLDRQPSPNEEYDMSDTEKIWRSHTLNKDMRSDSFPRHFRSISTYSPDYNHFVNNMESMLDGPSKSSVRFS